MFGYTSIIFNTVKWISDHSYLLSKASELRKELLDILDNNPTLSNDELKSKLISKITDSKSNYILLKEKYETYWQDLIKYYETKTDLSNWCYFYHTICQYKYLNDMLDIYNKYAISMNCYIFSWLEKIAMTVIMRMDRIERLHKELEFITRSKFMLHYLSNKLVDE